MRLTLYVFDNCVLKRVRQAAPLQQMRVLSEELALHHQLCLWIEVVPDVPVHLACVIDRLKLCALHGAVNGLAAHIPQGAGLLVSERKLLTVRDMLKL